MRYKGLLALVLVVLVVMPGLAHGGWSGSQTITVEYNDQWLTIYTSVLDYSITDDWHVTFVVDKHPIHGADLDFSSTYYLPMSIINTNIMYTTVGVRRGLGGSDTTTVPYFSVTVGF